MQTQINENLQSAAVFLEHGRKLEGQKVHTGNGLRQNQTPNILAARLTR